MLINDQEKGQPIFVKSPDVQIVEILRSIDYSLKRIADVLDCEVPPLTKLEEREVRGHHQLYFDELDPNNVEYS